VLKNIDMKQIYRVDGMSCAACSSSVESTLQSIDGVKSALVNLTEASVLVDYDPEKVSFQQMKEPLEKIGYYLREDILNNLEEEEKREKEQKQQLKNSVILAFVFSIPVFVLSMFFHHYHSLYWLQVVLSIPVIWAGRKMIWIGFKRLLKGKSTMDSLVAIGTSAAFIFSLVELILAQIGVLPMESIRIYFESAAIIIAFVLMGKYFEERAKQNTNESLKKLIGLQERKVIRINGNEDEEIDVNYIQKDDILRVLPGARIPLDGSIIEGHSYIDESMLTGESVPVHRKEGDKVIGGTLNQSGSFIMRVEKTGSETFLANIIQQVREAQSSKAPIQHLADKIASIFVPVVISIAILSFVLWLFFDPSHNFFNAFNAFFAVLVISCPCALGLATPTAIAVAMGQLAEKGILVKNAEAIQKAEKINILAIDKTGTLTIGKPQVNDIYSSVPVDETVLSGIKSIESRSEHPLGKAIIDYFSNASSNIALTDYQYEPGMGVSAIIENKVYLIGNETLMHFKQVEISDDYYDKALKYEKEGNTPVWVAVDQKVIMLIAIADRIKDNANEAIKQLRQMHINIHLLSGDNENTVTLVAKQLGIDNYKGNMLPAEKLSYIKALQRQNVIVGMAGDGINDAPALMQANVSFAMATGTDIAMDSADITLLHGDISKIAQTLKYAEKTMKVVKQNLFWAFIYNIIAIPLAAGAYYPLWHITLNPMIGGIAMSLSSVTVVSNSLRLKYLLK
jgi:Cu2+-exporting ATPase